MEKEQYKIEEIVASKREMGKVGKYKRFSEFYSIPKEAKYCFCLFPSSGWNPCPICRMDCRFLGPTVIKAENERIHQMKLKQIKARMINLENFGL